MAFLDNLKRNKDKVKQEKEVLNKVYLTLVNSGRYRLGVNKLLKECVNSYVWKYIQVDVVYNLLRNYNAYLVIYDEEYSNIYIDYNANNVYQVTRFSKKDYSLDKHNGEILLSSLNKLDAELIVDMIEGTSLWDYEGIVKIYGYLHKVAEDNYKSIVKGDYEDEQFVIAIFPSGDGQSIEIMINEENLRAESFFKMIRDVLEKYSFDIIMEKITD